MDMEAAERCRNFSLCLTGHRCCFKSEDSFLLGWVLGNQVRLFSGLVIPKTRFEDTGLWEEEKQEVGRSVTRLDQLLACNRILQNPLTVPVPAGAIHTGLS